MVSYKSPQKFLVINQSRLSGTTLNCGIHLCPRKCHQLFDHSKMQCEFVLHDQCPRGHKKSWKCHNPPPNACTRCDEDAKRRQDEKQKALKKDEKRAREDHEYSARIAKLDEILDAERQRLKDTQTSHERGAAILQKTKDIDKIRALADGKDYPSTHLQQQSADISAAGHSIKPAPVISTHTNNDKLVADPELAEPRTHEGAAKGKSPAKEAWEYQKKTENANNNAIDSVMDMVGLEEVKLQILKIKAKVDLSVRQSSDMKEDRLNVAFLGNPGTGMSRPKLWGRSTF